MNTCHKMLNELTVLVRPLGCSRPHTHTQTYNRRAYYEGNEIIIHSRQRQPEMDRPFLETKSTRTPEAQDKL